MEATDGMRTVFDLVSQEDFATRDVMDGHAGPAV